ncbi:retrovirus-related pol polyprotein from transposon TNT 1-94 [Tanacetum coccineum]
MFYEYFNPPPSAVSLIQVAATPRAVDIADSPVSTLIDQDAPSTKTLHEDSTSQGLLSNVRPSHTPFKLLGKWTKNHPIANVIRDPSRSVSTRKQLQTARSIKKDECGGVPKNKAQLVAKGYRQEEGLELTRIVKLHLLPEQMPLVSLLLNAAHKNMTIYRCVVKWPFLDCVQHSRVVYVYPDKPNHVYMVKKALYGLKQSFPLGVA